MIIRDAIKTDNGGQYGWHGVKIPHTTKAWPAIDLNFICALVEEKYCANTGTSGIDQMMLIKNLFSIYLLGQK